MLFNIVIQNHHCLQQYIDNSRNSGGQLQ